MIHGRKDDKLYEQSQAYDVQGRAIRAVDRGFLNKRLLDELEALPNVKLYFCHKLTGADFKKNKAWFEDQSSRKSGSDGEARHEEIEVDFDLLVGADGAHSATRFHMMKYQRLSYQQEYIDTLWCEFSIKPAQPGSPEAMKYNGFRMSPNHLHIWPAGDLMFIAIPSADKSFTCTLFMSATNFDKMDEDKDYLIKFFDEYFPGVSPDLISPTELKAQYIRNPHLPLISIKCEPYHFGSSVVILGDAAHAMVPFYGQGMNAGLEDVRVLYDVLDRFDPPMRTSRRSFTAEGRAWNRAAALAEYSFIRRKDAHTINDLAMGNYQEMRSDVNSRLYLLRKTIEEKLSVWLPWTGFKTQYSRISFSNERYSEVAWNVKWQHNVLDIAGAVGALAVAGVVVPAIWRWKNA